MGRPIICFQTSKIIGVHFHLWLSALHDHPCQAAVYWFSGHLALPSIVYVLYVLTGRTGVCMIWLRIIFLGFGRSVLGI